ncbi:MAG: M1 family aminopeptidase [Planctomycetota bacterium]
MNRFSIRICIAFLIASLFDLQARGASLAVEAAQSNVSSAVSGGYVSHLGHSEGASLCVHARSHAAAIRAIRSGGASPREADSDTDVIHYHLDIEIIPEYSGPTVTDVRVEGLCTVDVESTVAGLTEFTIDLSDNLTAIDVTGNVSTWSRVGHTIEITLDDAYDAGESFQVAVDYEGYPDSGGWGAFQWWIRDDLVVATLSEPFYAKYWWPCKDSLGDKATMRMYCTVPDPMIAVSNGEDEGTEALTGSRTKYKWHESYAMTAYLASLAITNYQRYDLSYNYDDGGGPMTMPLNCYLYPDHWDFGGGEPYSAYKDGCDELPTMLEVFSQQYGLYPFIAEKYGVAETGGAGGLGANMEHQTISSMYKVDGYSDIMAHELAHQWWGDDVTCATWYDIWLNEGFASYSESLFREFKPGGGPASFWSRVNSRRPDYPNEQVYRTNISSTSAIFSTNDVYNKGSWVVHMLRQVMGDIAFFDALANYRAAYTADYATTAEFTATMSASFGHDLSWFVDEWVMNPGSPDYRWNHDADNIGGQDYLKLLIRQEQDGEGYGLITMPVDIRVTTSQGATVHTVWNDAWEEYYVIPTDGAPLNVEFDEDGGTSDRNWILWDTRVKTADALEPPPVILSADIDAFAPNPGDTVIELVFSEEIGSLDANDVTLTGDVSGSHAPTAVTYVGGTQTATVTYGLLPNDDYTFVVLDDGVIANGSLLDGEVDDSAWWDDTLLPSGDGQPGGDAAFIFSILAGDADCSGFVDLDDIDEFVAVLVGDDTDVCHSLRADMNGDASADGADIQSFTEALIGG